MLRIWLGRPRDRLPTITPRDSSDRAWSPTNGDIVQPSGDRLDSIDLRRLSDVEVYPPRSATPLPPEVMAEVRERVGRETEYLSQILLDVIAEYARRSAEVPRG